MSSPPEAPAPLPPLPSWGAPSPDAPPLPNCIAETARALYSSTSRCRLAMICCCSGEPALRASRFCFSSARTFARSRSVSRVTAALPRPSLGPPSDALARAFWASSSCVCVDNSSDIPSTCASSSSTRALAKSPSFFTASYFFTTLACLDSTVFMRPRSRFTNFKSVSRGTWPSASPSPAGDASVLALDAAASFLAFSASRALTFLFNFLISLTNISRGRRLSAILHRSGVAPAPVRDEDTSERERWATQTLFLGECD